MPMRPTLMQYHTRPVTQVKYNRDGDLIVSASNDGNICLIRAEDGCRLGTYHGHEGAVKGIDISRDSAMVVSGGADSRVCFYETLTGSVIYTLMSGGIIKSVEFNQCPNKTNLLVTCADKFKTTPNNISIWRFWDGSEDANRNQQSDPKPFVPLSGEKYFGPAASGNNWGDFRIELICEISDDQLPMKAASVRFGPFDETVLSVHDEGTIYVWKLPDSREIQENSASGEGYAKASLLKYVDAHTMAIKSVQFNAALPGISGKPLTNPATGDPRLPGGERTLMLTASRDKTVKLWETQEYSLLKTYTANRPLNDAVISPLYQMDAVDESEHDAMVVERKKKDKEMKDREKKAKAGQDQPKEKKEAHSDDVCDNTDTEPSQPRFHIICGGGVEARDVTTSTEGGFESVFYHLVSCEELCMLRGHFGPMNSIAISPDGRSYVTGGEDGLLRLIWFDQQYFDRKDL